MGVERKSNTNSVPLALILIALGAMAFLGLDLLWPVIFILLPGLVMLFVATSGGKMGAVSMAVPGMMVAGTGALMTIQNITGYWQSWAYAWTLYAVFLGLAFSLMGTRLGEPTFNSLGRGFVYAGMVAFVIFGVFFEMLIFNGVGSMGAVLLIAGGLYLLSRGENGQKMVALFGGSSKSKRKPKPKRSEDKLFAGPIVYGSTVRSTNGARVSVVDMEEDDA